MPKPKPNKRSQAAPEFKNRRKMPHRPLVSVGAGRDWNQALGWWRDFVEESKQERVSKKHGRVSNKL